MKSKQIITKFLLSLFICGALFTPLISDHVAPKVEADCHGWCASEATQLKDFAETILNTASNGISAAGVTSLVTKEFALDGIANSIVKMLMQQMTASIIQWINSGFEGSPAFVTDLEGLLDDVANNAAEQFLGNITQTIDSQFGVDIESALKRQYYGGQDFKIQSTLPDPDSFFNEPDDGSWDQFREVAMNPQNSPYGAFLRARNEMNRQITEEIGRELEKLDWGDGTKSKEYCEMVEGENGSEENCQISMPGKQISDQLSFELSVGGRTLIEADEINEIVSALLGELAREAIRGARGLLGLSDKGEDGGDSYLQALANDSASSSDRFTSTVVRDALSTEERYLSAMQNIIAVIDEIDATNESRRQAYAGCYGLTIPTRLTIFRSEAQSNSVDSTENITALTSIIDEIEQPDITPAREQELLEIFNENSANGVLHTEIDVAQARNDMREIERVISGFDQQMNNQASQCERERGAGNQVDHNNMR